LGEVGEPMHGHDFDGSFFTIFLGGRGFENDVRAMVGFWQSMVSFGELRIEFMFQFCSGCRVFLFELFDFELLNIFLARL
jgi:hypothetical protein